jgi:hypothetical protein
MEQWVNCFQCSENDNETKCLCEKRTRFVFLIKKTLQTFRLDSPGLPDGTFLLNQNSQFWRVFQWKKIVSFMVNWSILHPFGNFCTHLVFLFSFGTHFPPFLVCCTNKNLATLLDTAIWKCTHRSVVSFLKQLLNSCL